mgnify:CR=1 FL=1
MISTGHIYKKSKLKLTSLSIVFPTGSIYDKEGKRGIYHLMEHLITKPLDKYQDLFTANCIEFNAMTSINYGIVYFNGLDSKLTPELKKEVVNCLLNNFNEVTEEQFNIEKQIVSQEIMDVYNDTFNGNLMNIFYSHYNVHDPAGIPDEVNSITFDEVKELARVVFNKPLRIVEIGPSKTEFNNITYNSVLPEPIRVNYKKTKKEVLPVQKGDKTNVMS